MGNWIGKAVGPCLSRSRTVTLDGDPQGRTEADVDNESNERARLLAESSQVREELNDYKAQLNSISRVREGLRRQLAAAQNSLTQERNEKANLTKNLQKCKILLKCEQTQRAEIEQSNARCESLLEEQTSRRLLGVGINIQGSYQTLPEMEASIRNTLTTTVSEWVEQGCHGLFNISKNDTWFIPRVLGSLFTLCKEHVDGLHQQYVDMFLGKVEGAAEDDMDPETAHFMRNHLRRHYLTLFSAVGATSLMTCRRTMTHLGNIMTDYMDDGACPDRATRTLLASGLEKITGQYLRILASCAVQHPAISFSDDCSRVQPFDKQLHFEPIDGDGDVAMGGQCMVVFPALLIKRDGSSDLEAVNKRFVLGTQEQA